MEYLVDSGSDLSVFPRGWLKSISTPIGYQLYAANGSIIQTYGLKSITLNLGLRRDFSWNFIIADVTKPIIGADFLSHYDLLVDLKRKCLRDGITGLLTPGNSHTTSAETNIKAVDGNSAYMELLREFTDITRPDATQRQTKKHSTVHHIRTSPGPPVSCKARRLAPDKLKIAQTEFRKMIDEGICRPSNSAWASPLNLAQKKSGEWRPCGDYRPLNDRTLIDKYSLRYLDDFAAFLHGKNIFSVVDFAKAFLLIPVAPEDVPKTAIITPFGLFEFRFMTFGLKNAAQTFQRFIDEVTRDLEFVFPYIDDILIASTDEKQHMEHLKILFERLREYGLVINVPKCQFGLPEVKFLGHLITKDGIKPLPEKVEAIVNFEPPTTVKALRRFLGTVNFYRKFIKNAAEILAPLNKILEGPKVKGSHPVNWTTELQESFKSAKRALADATLLVHPKIDADWAIFTDASEIGIGAVLQQKVDNNWQPLAFFSRKVSPSIQKLSTYDRELNAIYEAVKYFRHIFEGRHVTIYTDHKPLQHAYKQRTERASPWQFRRLDFIGQFTTDIRHVSGTDNIVADTLSRVEAVSIAITSQELADAQQTDNELQQLLRQTTALNLKTIQLDNGPALYCDTASGTVRPYVPEPLRKKVFNSLHSLAHPGIKGSLKMISKRYVWPSINKDCREWAKSCIDCQKNKIQRHVSSPIASFEPPTERFEHIHIDLVSLKTSRGFNQCLTIIDRFTRFPEAVPLSNGTAETIAHALSLHWISRHGVPKRITSDQGPQFESSLFQSLIKMYGIKHLHTTPYHPQANGLVERLHRQLKSALLCHQESWYDALPAVLLGLRAAWKDDIQTTPAELVYGEPIRLPGELLTPSNKSTPHDIINTLKRHFNSLAPAEMSRHGKHSVFCFRNLSTCSHVLVRNDQVGPSFSAPYVGPYRVITRHDKYFIVDFRGRQIAISVDRLKPVYEANSVDTTTIITNSQPTNTATETVKRRVRFNI